MYNHPHTIIGIWDDIPVSEDDITSRGLQFKPEKIYYRKITYKETNVRNGLFIDTKYDTLSDQVWQKDRK